MTDQSAEYSQDEASERMRGAHEATSDRLKAAGDRVQEIASGVTEQARQYGDKAQDAARQFKPFVERSLKDQPMATLAAAAIIGFVLGALWKK
jgi:ElaB/YqjD/DUF883 family membrane-anchored ribosome-binding protein